MKDAQQSARFWTAPVLSAPSTHRAFRGSAPRLLPEGGPRIAQRFNAGNGATHPAFEPRSDDRSLRPPSAPADTNDSVVPIGTFPPFDPTHPSVETQGFALWPCRAEAPTSVHRTGDPHLSARTSASRRFIEAALSPLWFRQSKTKPCL